jgi:phosphoglycolate phosphatase
VRRAVIRNVVVDLDGPILDGKKRHYTCYRVILESMGYPTLAVDEYWQLKRERTHPRDILARTGAQEYYDTFAAQWVEVIEDARVLPLDTIHAGALETLAAWASRPLRLILATLRQRKPNLYRQLDALELSRHFDEVVVCNAGEAKAQAVRVLALEPEHTVWIGDTEVDVSAARTLGMRSIAVTCGLRSEDFLCALHPDTLAASLPEVSAALQ